MKSVPLHDLARWARSAGLRPFEASHTFDLQGAGTAELQLTGTAWPPAPPVLSGQGELHGAQLLVPGLTRPIDLNRARIRVNQDHIRVEPLVAAMGDTVFTGWLEHQGERKRPWSFDLRASRLSLEEASQWLDAPGHRASLSFLELVPGLRSLAERRAAGWDLFGALNAQGHLAAPAVTYRAVTLGDFRTAVEVAGHIVRLSGATFRAGGGRGQGSLRLDLTERPAPVTSDVKLDGARLQNLVGYLPPALRGVRGAYSVTGHFETRGLAREEFGTNLRGQSTLRFRNVSFGGFDPLQAAARATSWGELEPSHAEAFLRSAVFTFEIRDRSVEMMKSPLEMGGGKIELSGHYGFDGSVEVNVRADFRRLARRWMDEEDVTPVNARIADFHVAGSLDKLAIAPEIQASHEPDH